MNNSQGKSVLRRDSQATVLSLAEPVVPLIMATAAHKEGRRLCSLSGNPKTETVVPFTTRVSRACNGSSYLLFMCVSRGSPWHTRGRMSMCCKEHVLDGLPECGPYCNGRCTLQRLRECLTSPNLALRALRGPGKPPVFSPPWKAGGAGF